MSVELRHLTMGVTLLDEMGRLRGLAGPVSVDCSHAEAIRFPVLEIKNGVARGAQLHSCVQSLPQLAVPHRLRGEGWGGVGWGGSRGRLGSGTGRCVLCDWR